MASINEIFEERINRLENVPDRFIGKVAATQAQLFNELMVILEGLGLSNGQLELNAANLQLVDDLLNQYYARLQQGQYGSLVSGYLQQMDVQRNLNNEYFTLEFDASPGAVSNAVHQSSKSKATRQLIGDDFKTNFINVVRDQVVQSVEGRASFSQLRDDLFGLFTDTTERQGLVHNWASQVSRDLFSVSDRAYNNAVAQELELQFIQYAGGLVRDSRPFCVARAGKFYHVREVESWAAEDWAGKFRNTTPTNILDWLGGYNCMHVAAYRSVRNVPETVVERNIASGNYQPTETERRLLGL